MKQEELYLLNDEDNKAAEMFVKLGMSKNLAKTLLYLSHVDECYSTEIERGAPLRQPEVSLAIKELKQKNLIKKRVFKKEKGKGRPNDLYKLKVPISDILKGFEQEKLKEIKTITDNISRLKNILTNE